MVKAVYGAAGAERERRRRGGAIALAVGLCVCIRSYGWVVFWYKCRRRSAATLICRDVSAGGVDIVDVGFAIGGVVVIQKGLPSAPCESRK